MLKLRRDELPQLTGDFRFAQRLAQDVLQRAGVELPRVELPTTDENWQPVDVGQRVDIGKAGVIRVRVESAARLDSLAVTLGPLPTSLCLGRRLAVCLRTREREALASRSAVAIEDAAFFIRDEAPPIDAVEHRLPRPVAEESAGLSDGDLPGRVAVSPLDAFALAKALEPEERRALPGSPFTSGAKRLAADDVLVHVAEEMDGEASCRVDLAVDLLPRGLVQPVRALMREENRDLALPCPGGAVAVARLVELPRVPDEASMVIAAGELQKRRVQAHDADAAAVTFPGRREVTGEQPVPDSQVPAPGTRPPPLRVGTEDFRDGPAVFGGRVGPEQLVKVREIGPPRQ